MTVDAPISFYIPARDAEGTLEACIEAVRGQTRVADELLILVDPRSTDRTIDIARASGERVVEQPGSTLSAARNKAVVESKHDWVAFCDSDVIIDRDWLAHLAGRRAQGVVGIAGRTRERIRSIFDRWRALHMPHNWGDHPIRNPYILSSGVLFHRPALLAVGGYRQDLNFYEDSDLCLRLRDAGYDLFYEPRATATHLRQDGLLDLLGLRWRYAEYRQRHRLDTYGGLVEKTRINHEYALHTLSRSLVRGLQDETYISFLLFFHHLVADLRSLLGRRPLLTQADRLHQQRELTRVAVAELGAERSELAGLLERDLSTLLGTGSAMEAGRRPACWGTYLDRISRSVSRFLAEFDDTMLSIFESSARHVHGEISADEVTGFRSPSVDALGSSLEGAVLREAVDGGFVDAFLERWPETRGVDIDGPLLDSEREVLRTANLLGDSEGPRATVVAHLEARVEPLDALRDLASKTRRLVVCYQPPSRFIPGLDVLSAADLASSAVECGWDIERFETLIGRTRLFLSR